MRADFLIDCRLTVQSCGSMRSFHRRTDVLLRMDVLQRLISQPLSKTSSPRKRFAVRAQAIDAIDVRAVDLL